MSDIKTNLATDSYNIKYNLALKFVNKILTNANKPPITQLTEFKDVIRQEIVADKNLQALTEMEKDIYTYFDKTKCGFYRKSNNYVFNCLRGVLRQIEYKIMNIEQDRTIKINGINYRKKFMIYRIEK